MGIFSNLRVKQNNRAKMKLGFVLFAAAAANPNLKCNEKSEKKLNNMKSAFNDWANDYGTAKYGPTTSAHMINPIENITSKMLSHYTEHNAEICNDGARMGDEDEDLSYDSCVSGLKILHRLGNWSRSNNKVKKSTRVAAKLRGLRNVWEVDVCNEHM